MERQQKIQIPHGARRRPRARGRAQRDYAAARTDNGFGAKGFGSPEHRKARDKVEKAYDDARRDLESLSDERLDARLGLGRARLIARRLRRRP